MEDFDYIDELAKQALSNRTANPSDEGWNVVQQKMKRQKRKRLLIYMFFFALLCSLGIFIGLQTNSENSTTVSGKDAEHSKLNTNSNEDITKRSNSNSDSKLNSTSSSDSTSSSNTIANDASPVKIDTSVGTFNATAQQHSTSNNLHGEKNGLVQIKTAHHSQLVEKDKNSQENTSDYFLQNPQKNASFDEKGTSTFLDTNDEFYREGAGLKLYPWELVAPTLLPKKHKKQQTKKKEVPFYEQLDLMVGFNGFVRPNDYNFIGSYVVELSFTEDQKLKKNYFFTYGMSLQFRNLRFKNDMRSFNKGELSLNMHSGLKKRFGDFGVEGGTYLGYELHSPNNEFFNNDSSNFFEEKINYGLFSILHYKKIGLVFKYEFSPYINYLGDKQFGAFTIGIKYDF
ncbi:MAG: hypothetical protein AAF617_09640 [Bacteroidota bacterium]